ncbi:MAG: hypothetical protein PHQ19_04020 [Candidatus Krumholzibacteria bacterium]|nr:hypothetical protein [Candidatus Krumholzibacteria bacterium]
MEDARDLVGCTVFVLLEDASGLAFAGIEGEGPFLCAVTAVDEIGMWVRNRRFVTVELRDSRGRAVPKSKREPRISTVDILIPWKNVRTVVRFADEGAVPEAAGPGAPGGAPAIGFVTEPPARGHRPRRRR